MTDHYAVMPITLSGSSELILGDQFEDTFELSGESSLEVTFNVPTMAATGGTVVSGLLVDLLPNNDIRYTSKYVGEPNIPQDIKRLRRSTYEVMRRMGTPVVIKPMLTHRHVVDGYAENSPNFNTVYGQSRFHDKLDHGTGFVSREKSETEWISSSGHIVDTDTGTPAPKYRGYGPGVLTWIIEPDAAEDFFKHTEEGVLIKVQTAMAQSPWWPDIADNDLLVHVSLDDSLNITGTYERYQAKIVNPVSLRGLDRRGRKEYTADLGNRHVINQTFEMALLPREHAAYEVDLDR